MPLCRFSIFIFIYDRRYLLMTSVFLFLVPDGLPLTSNQFEQGDVNHFKIEGDPEFQSE